MKKILIPALIFFSVFSLYAKAIQEDMDKADETARVSYAFGMLFGSNLSTVPLEFDYDAFTEGFRVMFENDEPLLTRQEAVEIVETAMYYAMEKASEESRKREEEFLIANSQRMGVHITPSGLQYEVLSETDGPKPEANSTVRVTYIGSFVDGSVFDRSDPEGAYIPMEMVIPGWTEGLMLMGVGSRYRLYIPSNLAYGKSGVQNVIPPYSTLIFTVELLEIMDSDYSE